MRIGDVLKLKKNAKKFKKNMDELNRSEGTMAGVPLPDFVGMIVKNPQETISKMTDDELISLFEHESIADLFNVMPHLQKLYNQEKQKRNI